MRSLKKPAKVALLLCIIGIAIYFMGWIYPVYPDFKPRLFSMWHLQLVLNSQENLLYPDLDLLSLEEIRYTAELDGRTFASHPIGNYQITGYSPETQIRYTFSTDKNAEEEKKEADEVFCGIAIWIRDAETEIKYYSGAKFNYDGRWYHIEGNIYKSEITEPENDPEQYYALMRENLLLVCKEMIAEATQRKEK